MSELGKATLELECTACRCPRCLLSFDEVVMRHPRLFPDWVVEAVREIQDGLVERVGHISEQQDLLLERERLTALSHQRALVESGLVHGLNIIREAFRHAGILVDRLLGVKS